MASNRAWLALAFLGLAFGGCECISDPAKGGRNKAGNGASSSGGTAAGPSSASSGGSSASTSGPGTDTGSGSSHGAGSGGASSGAGTASGSGAGTVSSSGTSVATQGGSTGPGSTTGSTSASAGSAGSTATASTSSGGSGSNGSTASTGATTTSTTSAAGSTAGSTAGAGTSSGTTGVTSTTSAGPATTSSSSSSSSTTTGGSPASTSGSSSGAGSTGAGSTGGVGTSGTAGTTCAAPTYGTVTTSGGSGTTIITSIGGPGPIAPHGAPLLGTTTGGYSGLVQGGISPGDGGVVVDVGSTSGTTATTATSASFPDAGTASAGSTGSTSSTGFADAGSPTTTGTSGTTGTPPPQVREWAAWHMPDSVDTLCVESGSVVPCSSVNRQPNGQDGDYLTNPTSYFSLSAGTLTDSVTGLRWSMDPSSSRASADFASAVQYCAKYGSTGEFRLPTPIELASLLDLGRQGSNPLIASDFSDALLDVYWTQLSSTTNTGVAWQLSFSTGFITEVGLSSLAQVRCVSDWNAGPPPFSAPSDFTTYDADGGVSVANSYTGLEWQAYPSQLQLTWDDALAYCNALADQDPCRPWRLPSYKELLTLVDFAGGGTMDANFPWVPTSSGSGPQYGTFWSSSPAPNAPFKSLMIDFPQFGGGPGAQVGYNARQATQVLQVRCVRNYP